MRLRLYKSYNFRNKAPIIDAIFTSVDDSGMSWSELAKTSNVALGTIKGWRGKTRRPQFATTAAIVRALPGETGIMFDEAGRPYIVGVRRKPKLKGVGGK